MSASASRGYRLIVFGRTSNACKTAELPVMTADITFHYPPELFNLLVDTIPVLNRSKKDVLLFFRGAGVSGDLVDDIAKRLKSAPSELNKYEMVRTILDGLNTRGEATLIERREVLRRV